MPEPAELLERGIRCERTGILDEALSCYEAAASSTEPAVRSEALRRAADVHRIRCEWDAALDGAGAAADVARGAGLSDAHAEALNAEAAVHQSRGDLDRAATLYHAILDITSDRRIRGIALQNLGGIAGMRGDGVEAADRFQRSLECFEEAGYERGVVMARINVGRAAMDRGDFARALGILREAVPLARKVDDLELAALASINLGEALLGMGNTADAEEELSAALGFFKISGNLWRQITCARLLGDIWKAQGQPDVARRLYRQGLRLAEEIGAEPDAVDLRQRLNDLPPDAAPPVLP